MSKRQFDLLAIFLTSFIWVPVLIASALLMALIEGRPVFYRSNRRVSRHVNMRIVKFRTMVRNAEAVFNRQIVPVTTQRFLNTPSNSPLYTGFGRWVERFQVTELPQIFHVLAGQMSVVGNRPLPENVIDSLRQIYPQVEERFDTPAGLTGLTQLVGREELSDIHRLQLEGHYCRAASSNYSARLDLLILLLTVGICLRLVRPFTVQSAHALIDRYSPGARGQVEENRASPITEQDIV